MRKSRGSDVAKELLGATFAGMLVSDRWAAYNWVDVSRRQLCWAHLLRQFVGFQDYGDDAHKFGSALERLTEEMFGYWHRVRDGTMTRRTFQKKMRSHRRVIVVYLRACSMLPVTKVAGRAKEILTLEPALWTFVDHEGIEPTNNHAERAVRPAVLWRKGSFGTDSAAGSLFVGRILTVVTTLRLQKRNVLDYITEACRAVLAGRRPDSLLPVPVDASRQLAAA